MTAISFIFNVWEDEGWEEPIIEERFDPDRTVLTLSFEKKASEKSARKKASEKSVRKKVTEKTKAHYDAIRGYSDAAKPPVRRNGNHLSDGRKPQLLLVRRSRLSGVWHEPLVRTNVSHR